MHSNFLPSALWPSLLDAMPLPMFFKNREGCYLGCNRAFSRFTGIAFEALAGRTVMEVWPGNLAEEYHRHDLELMAAPNGHQTYEFEVRGADGALHPVIFSKDVFRDERGEVAGIVGTFTDISNHKKYQSQLERIAYYDPLTELPNRRLLRDRMCQALTWAAQEGSLGAVCYLDLDGFKPINDDHGHTVGDGLLRDVARRLLSCVRDTDTVARLGGDEFVLLLINVGTLRECEVVLDRVRAVLAAPFESGARLVEVTASVGVALFPVDDTDPDTLLRHADHAMYVAKHSGRNRHHVFEPHLESYLHTRRDVRVRLAAALAGGEFQMLYQPKVSLRTGAVVGAEAFARWRHPERGLLLPAKFISTVEDVSLAAEFGWWVVDAVLRQMAAWAETGLVLPTSINISSRHLHSPDFAAGLAKLLAAHPTVRPEWVELEIAETVALDDIAHASKVIGECSRLGVSVALDNFGTGRSSPNHLQRLPVRLIKIDRSFIRGMAANPGNQTIVKGAIDLAHALGRQVIAKGVETPGLGRMLLSLGCELVQGHGIASPLPPEEVPGWVAAFRLGAAERQ